MEERAQWPHTIQDITRALDQVWGVVGATGTNGNLYRLEKSLKEPTTYTVTEYQGEDEGKVLSQKVFDTQAESGARDLAVKLFAKALGFRVD